MPSSHALRCFLPLLVFGAACDFGGEDAKTADIERLRTSEERLRGEVESLGVEVASLRAKLQQQTLKAAGSIARADAAEESKEEMRAEMTRQREESAQLVASLEALARELEKRGK